MIYIQEGHVSMHRLSEIEKNWMKPDTPTFHIGDTVDVHVRITEGDKERIQVFTGVVIARKGSGIRETFSVRRIVQGEGVERVFPLHSPMISDIQIRRRGQVRRSKLYYLRDRVGKSTRVREKIGGFLDTTTSKTQPDEPEAEEPATPEEAVSETPEETPTPDEPVTEENDDTAEPKAKKEAGAAAE